MALQALREVRRVLSPGRTLHFVEHGPARTSRCAAGSAGLTINELDVIYEDGTPKSLGADSPGIATVAVTHRWSAD